MAMLFQQEVWSYDFYIFQYFIITLVFVKAGRYCEWEHQTIDRSAEIETFEEYMKTLVFKCEDGEPGYLNWTVPMNAPDELYYQVRKKYRYI